jgi:probable HAF family extracellular repeat protein
MRARARFRAVARLLGLTLLATALLAGPATAATPAAIVSVDRTPRITDLGNLGGNEGSFAAAINNRGEVVGNSSTTEEMTSNAFLWRNGVMRDLGTLGGSGSTAKAINDQREVVGFSSAGDSSLHAFLWRNGVMRDLGTLGGSTSYAYGINNRGEVVGGSETADGSTHAFLWRNGVMRDLGTLGGASSFAYAINDRGEVVGNSSRTEGMTSNAFLWRNGVMHDLGSPSGTYGSTALDINKRGDIVGYTITSQSNRALLWHNGVMHDLGTLGGAFSWATGINEQGLIVGHSETAAGEWRGFALRRGVMTALPTLAATCDVWGVNDRGQVVGDSFAPSGMEGRFHAVLWS